MGGLNPGLWTGLLLLAFFLSSATAQTPCQRTSGTLSPTDIVVNIDEARKSDLDFNGKLERYRDQLNINGDLFSTVTLVLEQLNALINPNEFFLLENTPNEGITIRLNKELDRDMAPIGTTVFDKVAATDNDLGQFKEIYFSVVPAAKDDGSEYFAIDRPLEGYVTVKKQLDYETLVQRLQTVYTVNISASDNSLPESGRRIVYTTLEIRITDGDDLEPVFEYETCTKFNGVCYNPRYTTTIISGVVKQGELVIYPYPAFAPIQRAITIRARDLDTLNSSIRFNVQETIPEGYEQAFSVFTEPPSPGSGSDLYRAQLYQNATINRAQTSTVRIFIRAVEDTIQSRYERALVTATILPANNFAPLITTSINSYTAYIPENSARGTLITDFSGTQFLRLEILDRDVLSSDREPFYTFAVLHTSLFTVTSEKFIALNSDVLDFESMPVLIFGVVVTEGSTAQRRSSTSTFTVSVQDRNDFSPVFQAPSYSVSVPEGDYTFLNQQFLTVTATDADTGFNQVVSYSIADVNNNGGSLFSIAGGSGALSAVGVLPRNTLYTIIVQASDNPNIGSSRSTTAAVVVNVTKSVNQGPSIPASVYNTVVSEGVPLATSVFNTPASDPEGDTLTYSIIFGNSQNDFLIGPSDGVVRNRARLDFESRPSYGLIILVQDQSLRTATTTLNITVTDINDNNPFFLNSTYVFFAPENQTGYIVGTVEARDQDEPGSFNAQVSYSYAPSSSSRFAINRNSGTITTVDALDYETQSQYLLVVEAADSAVDRRSSTVTVTVNVLDVEDNVPIFVRSLYEASVVENSVNALVITVTAEDADSVKNVTYQLIGADASTFTVTNGGEIFTNGALDYETRSFYEFVVTTSDGLNDPTPSASATVRISVVDINDFAPEVRLSYTYVNRRETTPIGDLLTTALAVDKDPSNTANSRMFFSIATVKPISGLNLFYINPIDGDIFLGQSLSSDMNGFTLYEVTVQATDFGTPALSGSAVLSVHVMRNTYEPVFVSSSFSASVAQTLSVGSNVIRISADDADTRAPFNVITYSIIGNGNAPSFFKLNSAKSGQVIVRDTLTKESALSYSLVVVATDGGGTSETATATIVVERNLNNPQFTQTAYTRTIDENYPLATSVIQILAVDNDILSPHNQLQYTIVGNTEALDYFTISETGLITLKRSPANSATDNFTITIALRDQGLPQSRAAIANAVVNVNILRNENPPIFFNATFSAQINETVPVGTSVIRVTATDSDTNPQFNLISYSVIGDDTAPNYFDVNSGSGNLITTASLTTENINLYRVRVLATDNGIPTRSATAMVIVTVLRNFVSPIWPQTSYSTNVLETQSLGVPIITVTANDNDVTSPNNLVYYELTGNSEAQSYFQVDRFSGQISVRTSLTTDANNPSTYTLTIRASDGGSPSRTSTVDVPVRVNVIRNVNEPQFLQSGISREVSQNAQVGDQIVQVNAVDADGQGSFGQVFYSIVGVDTAPTLFAIDSQTGAVTLSKSLATDTLIEYRLLIQAADNGYPAKTDLTVVTIFVNRNLNPPVFVPSVYNVTILDNSNLGDVIVKVTASDSDFIAPYNVVSYSGISTARALDLFFVNSVTGDVSVKRPLTDDSAIGNNLYTLKIRAQDQGGPIALIAQPATVFINVIRNQFSPFFSNTPYSVDISQNTGLFASIFTVLAVDNDLQAPYNTVTYSVIGDDQAPNFFAINPATGVVTVTQSLLTGSASSYRLRLVASDGGNPTRVDYEVLTINVDRNTFAPSWVNPTSPGYTSNTQVLETIDYSTVLFTVSARDLDTTAPFNQVTYSLIGEDKSPTFFDVNPNSGEIRLRSSLLQDTDQSYKLLLKAFDSGFPSQQAQQTATVLVDVLRNLNTPYFLSSPYAVTIPETTVPGSSIFKLTARDDDLVNTFETLSFDIIGDGAATVYFDVESFSGIVRVVSDLTAATDIVYYVRARVRDNGQPTPRSNTTLLTVTILRNMAPPVFSPVLYREFILDTTPLGTVITTVRATDSDTSAPHNVIRYTYRSGTTGADRLFYVNSITGEVSLSRALQQGSGTSFYELLITASDEGIPSRSAGDDARVQITVTRNQNDPIFISTPYALTIPESQAVGSSVFKVTATDADSTAPLNVVSLRAIGDDQATVYFSLTNDGVISVNSNLLLDTNTLYRLRVEARDGGTPPRSATALVSINVRRNLASPVFVQNTYETTILETQSLGVNILRVSATDADTKRPHNVTQYYITNDVFSSLGEEYFLIDSVTGEIYLRKAVLNDELDTPRYTFSAFARDTGVPQLTSISPAAVTVNVVRNLNAPVFTQPSYSTPIDNSLSVGSNVFTVTALDADSQVPFNTVTYDIIGDGDSQLFFSIGGTTGLIRLQQSILFRNELTYSVRVRARDGGSPRLSSTAVVTVSVNRNLFDPIFSELEYTIDISETTAPGTGILFVSASDNDVAAPYNRVTYAFSATSSVDRFLIDEDSGQIFVRRNLVGEAATSFVVNVVASDSAPSPHSSIPVKVTINIRRNNNPPQFINEPYTASFTSSIPVGSSLITVTATDSDLRVPFNQITYSIIGDDAAPTFFSVNSNTGVIYLLRTIDSNVTDIYRVRVVAADSGVPPRTDTTVVYFNITRNLVAPEFNLTFYTISVSEDRAVGNPFLQVTALDADVTAPNNLVTYTLTGNTRALQYFQVGISSGQVSVLQPLYLDQDKTQTYNLVVTARDRGFPSRPAINTATVTVVVNRNNNPPIFLSTPYDVTISTPTSSGTSVRAISVTDADLVAPFNTVTVSVIGDDSAPIYFTLGNDNVIRVSNTSNLNADTETFYRLRLLASDFGYPSLTATATVGITVRRNLFSPRFTNNTLRVTIAETAAVGTFIADLNATDSDTDSPNNQFQFSLVGDGDSLTYFFVNPLDGRVTLLQSVENTNTSGYRLRVRVTDGGKPQLSSETFVEVTIVRDTENLVFTLPRYTDISENLGVNKSVISAVAQPQDGVTYRVTGYSDGPDYFNINATTGTIFIKTDLRSDRNRKSSYLLGVEATRTFQAGLKTATADVEINVRRNDNPPVFRRKIYTAVISEYTSLGSSVVQLLASDADTQDVLKYSVVPRAGGTDSFYLGPSTGLLSLRTLQLGLTTTQYTFDVLVSDQSDPERTDTATVDVTIIRDTFTPQFINVPYNTVVGFNSAVGTSIFRVTATDDDLVGNIEYEINGFFAAPGYFNINPSTGVITIRSDLGTDVATFYLLGVRAFDSARPSQVAFNNVTVNVNRNPSIPVFDSIRQFISLPEKQSLGITVASVTATDADENTVRYSITDSVPFDGTSFFYVNPENGEISVVRPLTETTENSFTLRIIARDNGLPVSQSITAAEVIFNIIRNEFAPFFVNEPYHTIIREDISVGTSILIVSAQDGDAANSGFADITYALIGDDAMPSYFSLDSATGVISVRQSLTAETTTVYQGRIVALDSGSPPKSATVLARIEVTRNLFVPHWDELDYFETVLETLAVGTSVLQMRAFDNDTRAPFNTVRYSLQSATTLGNNYFQIDAVSGFITVRAPLNGDSLRPNSYTFHVVASDQGIPSLTASFTATVVINVQRNRNPPIFANEPYSANVNFNTAPSTSVINVLANDADSVAPYNKVTYSIIGDDQAPSLFSINAVSGRISTSTRSLAGDTALVYRVRVLARDGGSPSLSATSTVLVNVERNLNPPTFLRQNYSVTIFETQDLGDFVQQISAIDQDISAPYNTLTFDIVGDSSAQEYFDIRADTGSIFVQKALSLTSQTLFQAMVSVRDNGSPARSAAVNAFVTITVIRNNFVPQFTTNNCNRDLSQNNNIGSSVTQVAATDADTANTPFGSVVYDIIGDDSSPVYFSINSVTGVVSIAASLAQENVDEYRIRIRARDSGTPFKFNTTVCVLTITRNFQPPVFLDQQYTTVVPETFPLGNVLLTVSANDNDLLAPNNVVRYEITADDEDKECFLLNDITGNLFLRRSLLYNPCRATAFSMRVIARDLGTPQLSSFLANVTVVVYRNLFAPEFLNLPYITTMEENAVDNRLVYSVTTRDQDSTSPFNNVTLSIIGDDSSTSFFNINANNGDITLARSILTDTETSYRVRVLAQDGGTPALTATATVNVQVRRNLFSPRFSQLLYETTILEIQDLGVEILRVNATDDDTKSPYNIVRYEAVGVSSQSYFAVNSVTGVVSAQRALTLNQSATTQYTLTVRAYDLSVPRGESPQFATVRINVIRNDNCPVFSNLPNDVTISQTTNQFTTIYNVSAFDSDPAGRFSTLQYDVIGDDNAPVYFTINRVTGQVSTSTGLFSDLITTYKLRVRATDGGSPACERFELLTIKVRRNEFTPQFVPNENFAVTILENQSVQAPIIRIQASDRDISSPNNIVNFGLTSDRFTIDTKTGDVYVRSSLIDTSNNLYEIHLRAFDSGEPSMANTTGVLRVTVIRNQVPPVFQNEPYQTTLNQNALTGTSVAAVLATDDDTSAPFNTVQYSIIGDDSSPSYFNINPTTGAIFLSQSIATDPTDIYYIRVQAQDSGSPRLSDTTVVVVDVQRNLLAPIMSSDNYTTAVLETQAVGTPVGIRVTANDADTTSPNNNVMYSMVGDTDDMFYFSIDSVTGEILIRRSLVENADRNITMFAFQVYAYDLGVPRHNSSFSNVRISVLRNNVAPRFLNLPYARTIFQNQTTGASIFQTTAVDTDNTAPFNVVRYQLIGDDSTPTFFTVDSTTGLISLRPNADIRTDTESKYFARFLAYDGGVPSLSATAVVSISVLRNLFPPLFTNNDFIRVTIPETTPVGTFIAQVNATDTDTTSPENQVTYSLQGDFPAEDYFFINPNTGDITLLVSVDNLNVNLFRIRCVASDGGEPTQHDFTYVEVTILRETGQLSFNLPSYQVVISENTAVGSPIITASAQPGLPIYRLLGIAPGPTYFAVGSSTGSITVLKDLRTDNARLTSYRLEVQAELNTGVSIQRAQAFVNITVTRNENGPIFSTNNYVKNVQGTISIGTVLLTVTAQDADGDVVAYEIVDPLVDDAGQFFYLNPRSGDITLKQTLFQTGRNLYRFRMRARDQRVPERTAISNVTISVIRDASDPIFLDDPYFASVTETAANGTSVYRASAVDSDLRGNLVYEVIGDGVAPAFFTVNSLTGLVSVYDRSALLFDRGTAYVLRLVVYDSVYPSSRDTAEVSINVLRNFNAPTFRSSIYRATIPDTYALGFNITQVTATDLDQDVVKYELLGETRALEYYYLNPETGVISLKKLLTQGSQITDTLNIRVRDQGSPEQFGSTVAIITILRDQASPNFVKLPYRTTVQRSTAINSTVVRATAVDADLQGVIRYEVIGNYPAPTFFDVNSVSGDIFVKQSLALDSLLSTTYFVAVTAYDTVYPNNVATATATIFVDRNPNGPIFNTAIYQRSVVETIPIGSSIVDVNATDLDGDVLRYSLVGDPIDQEFFYLNEDSGFISLRKTLVSTKTTQFRFLVLADDMSNPARTGTASVIVNVVRDVAAPVFQRTPYNTGLLETVPLGTSVYQVTAVDSDLKGSIVYSVIGDFQASFYFGVESNTGIITVRNNLRDDIAETYKIRVVAYDSASPAKTATATVDIVVSRNPNAPVFRRAVYEVTIAETYPMGTVVEQVFAWDTDGDAVLFSLQSSGISHKALDYFYILEQTGDIFLRRPLTDDVTREPRLTMTVRARDQRLNERVTDAMVIVNVVRNRFLPTFLSEPYVLTVSENTVMSSIIGQVTAVDSDLAVITAVDSDLAGQLAYNVIGDSIGPFYFGVNETSGRIFVMNNLRTDRANFQYSLRVQVADTAYPLEMATATVKITVIRNEFPPIFTASPYRTTINETTEVGVGILQVAANDQDGDRMVFTASGETDTLSYFYLSADTGLISVRRPLTSDTKNEYRMVIVASDSGNPEKRSTVEAFITVIRDQGPPFFINLPYRTAVNELVIAGTSVLTVQARDLDLIGDIRYELIGDYPTQSFFSLDAVTGELATSSSLLSDSLRASLYKARVVAYDTARPTVRTTATADITVLRNPNAPVWLSPDYAASIRETAIVGSTVLNTTATDQDVNDVLTYEILSQSAAPFSPAAAYFYIDRLNGIITLRESTLASNLTQFFLLLRVCDSGFPARCANSTASISVVRNQFPPVWQQLPYQIVIAEDRTPDSVPLLTIQATDSDLLGSIVYEQALPGVAYFDVDPSSGALTLQSTLRLDSRLQITFQVVAYDSQDPIRRVTADVTVFITRNPSGPAFLRDPYERVIGENFPLGDIVMNTTAIDLDGDVLRYSIASANNKDQFYINPDNGIITLRQLLTTNSISRFTLLVTASDQRIPERTATTQVIITVSRDNVVPFFVNTPYFTQITETRAVSSSIFNVFAHDSDLVGEIRYEAIGVYPATSFFAVSPVTGAITVTTDLKNDALLRASYTLTVVAYDNAYASTRATADVTIEVVRNENGPVFQPSATYQVTVPDEITLGALVLTVTAVDRDAGDVVTYTLLGNSAQSTSVNATLFFFLDRETGEIRTRRPLTEAPLNLYTVTVRAEDNRGRSNLASVRVIISRVTDNPPVFQNTPYRTSVDVIRAINSTIYSVSAVDPDGASPVRYNLAGYFPGTLYFSLNSVTGDITLVQNFDRDVYASLLYVLRVEAYEVLRPEVKVQENVLIDVIRNPSPPVFERNFYTTTIAESVVLGTSVLQINAVDADGDVTVYEIDSSSLAGSSASEVFYLNPSSGVIFVRNDLRTSSQNQYTFIVRSRDQSYPERLDTATVQIDIIRDQFAPLFSQQDYRVTIPKTSQVNSTLPIITVLAFDRDLQNRISYRAVGDGSALAFFSIDFINGGVFVKNSLTQDSLITYNLRVEAFDTFYPNNIASANVSITVIRNPSSPQFQRTSYVQNVAEYEPAGSQLLVVSAVDLDGDIPSYRLLNVGECLEYFYIFPDTGAINLRKNLFANPTNQYVCIVQASDQRTSARLTNATVTINVIRSQPSRFQSTPYTFSVSERSPVGASVYRVTAFDPDLKGVLMYDVVGVAPGPSYFQLNTSTGVISPRVDLKVDTTQNYVVSILCLENVSKLG
ncbi:hypothetical protein ACOMHN_046165 [Nucella lapillus]